MTTVLNQLTFDNCSKGLASQGESIEKTTKRSLWQSLTFQEGAIAHITQNLTEMYGKTGILTIPFQLNEKAGKVNVGVAVKSKELGVSVMYPFNAGSSSAARKVSIQINFDKNVVHCLVNGKKKGLIFNGPKDLRKTSFGLFVETKNQGSCISILNNEITFVQK